MKKITKIMTVLMGTLMMFASCTINVDDIAIDTPTDEKKSDSEKDIETTYSVTISNSSNGTVTSNKTIAKKDEIITLIITPNEGYELDSISVENNIALNGTNNIRTFTMPEKNVIVNSTFKPISQITNDDETEQTPPPTEDNNDDDNTSSNDDTNSTNDDDNDTSNDDETEQTPPPTENDNGDDNTSNDDTNSDNEQTPPPTEDNNDDDNTSSNDENETTVSNNNGVLNYQFNGNEKLCDFTYIAYVNNELATITYSNSNGSTENNSSSGFYTINNNYDIRIYLNYNDNKIEVTRRATTPRSVIINNVEINETTTPKHTIIIKITN